MVSQCHVIRSLVRQYMANFVGWYALFYASWPLYYVAYETIYACPLLESVIIKAKPDYISIAAMIIINGIWLILRRYARVDRESIENTVVKAWP